MSKYLRYIWLVIVFLAAIISLISNYKYAFTLIAAAITLTLVGLAALLVKGIKLPKFLFNQRFFWYYPLGGFMAFILYQILKLSMRGELFMVYERFYFLLGISLLVGGISGVLSYIKVMNKRKDNKLYEDVEVLNSDYDTLYSGILTLSESNHLVLYEKDKIVLDIAISEIEALKINAEYKIFSTHLILELNKGETLLIDSMFPKLWKNEIQKEKQLASSLGMI